MLASRALCRRTVAPARPARTNVTVKASIKLYTNPASRGRIVEWYLKELGVEAELINLDMKEKREHRGDAFLKVNPFGKVPALVDGDLTLFESGALLTYLADKYGKLDTPEKRAKANQWVLFANTDLAYSWIVEAYREKLMPDVFGNLDKVLADRDYLEDNTFSVADVAVGSYLLYIPAFFPQMDLSAYPNVVKYMDRLAARPACAATVAARAQQRSAEESAAAAAEKK